MLGLSALCASCIESLLEPSWESPAGGGESGKLSVGLGHEPRSQEDCGPRPAPCLTPPQATPPPCVQVGHQIVSVPQQSEGRALADVVIMGRKGAPSPPAWGRQADSWVQSRKQDESGSLSLVTQSRNQSHQASALFIDMVTSSFPRRIRL